MEHALEAIWDPVIWITRFVTEFYGAETTPLITGPRHSTLSALLDKGGDGGLGYHFGDLGGFLHRNKIEPDTQELRFC